MNDFKWSHFQGDIILGCVSWYCKYGISYRNLEEMVEERGVLVDHTTLNRWVNTYAPELEKRLRCYWKPGLEYSRRVDEIYVRVKGKWAYLYRAIDKRVYTLDFYLSPTSNATAAKRFLSKALRRLKAWEIPRTINIDKAASYAAAIKELKDEGICPVELEHRQIKYLNNLIEADHDKLKQLIKPTLGFKSLKTAYATIKGFEVMRMFRKGQMDLWKYDQGLKGEIRLNNQQFNIYSI